MKFKLSNEIQILGTRVQPNINF